MKKTQFKDTLRNIRKEIVSYLSIVIIALLAVTSYLGINFSSFSLESVADNFYRQHNFRDIEITSTLLLSGEDMKAFEETEGVEKVEGIYYASGIVKHDDALENVGVMSLTEQLNTVELREGRLPQSSRECVLEEELLKALDLSVGDHLQVTDSAGEVLSYLNGSDYLITGSVVHPDHFAYRAYVPGDRYILVNKEAFDLEKLDGCFMKAIIRVADTENDSMFSKKYHRTVQTLRDKLEPLNDELEKRREESIRNSMQEKIDEAEQKLKDARAELDEKTKLLEENKKKYEDAVKQLEDAKKQLEDGKAKLDAAEALRAEYQTNLDNAKAQLDSAKALLDEGKAKLDAAKARLDETKKLLDAGKAALDGSNAALTDAYNKAEDAKDDARTKMADAINNIISEEDAAKIHWAEPAHVSDASDPNLSIYQFAIIDSVESVEDSNLTVDLEPAFTSIDTFREKFYDMIAKVLEKIERTDKYDEIINTIEDSEIVTLYDQITQKLQKWTDDHNLYVAKKAEYDNALALYNSALAQYNEGLAQYNSRKAEYDAGLAKYNDGLAQFDAALAQLNEGKALYEQKLAEYNDGVLKLAEGKKELEEGEEKLKEAEAEYKDGEQELNDAKKKLQDLPHCFFVMMDTGENGGYLHVNEAASNVGKLGITFALVFILVGALVIYVTLGRIIGEQRTLVGAQKALGFFNKEVLMKYLMFGTSSTLIGMLIGTVLGYYLIQKIVLGTYNKFYVVNSIPFRFKPVMFAVVIIAGILLSAAAVCWACMHLLKETARELMQYELPKGKKKTSTRTSSKASSLYSRLIFRNMTTDLRRVLITTISIAGCCTLLVIGFHMRYSINKSLEDQFDVIMKYKQEISFDPNLSSDPEKEITEALKQKGIEAMPLACENYTFDGKGSANLAKLYCSDPEIIKSGFRLEPSYGEDELLIDDEGVIIPRKIAELNGLKPGDFITMYDTDFTPLEVKISNVYDNYMGRFFFMSRGAYQKVFGREPQDNVLWTISDLNKDQFDEIAKGIPGYNGVSVKSETKKMYGSLTKILTIITLVLIIASGMMAFFVLMNLVNMYLNRKKRELVVMRINGFTTKEVLRYVSMESIITTIAGIILGLLLGSLLGNIIIRILEQGTLLFFHGISFSSWLYSAAITAVFSIVINSIALRKVKHLKLNDM